MWLAEGEVNGFWGELAASEPVAGRAAATSITTAAGGTTAGAGLGELRGVELIDGCEEFFARSGEVLEEVDFVIEMDEEGLVFVFAEDVIEERAAGGALLLCVAALAEAGVD